MRRNSSRIENNPKVPTDNLEHISREYIWSGDITKEEKEKIYYEELIVKSKLHGINKFKVRDGKNVFILVFFFK